MVIIDDLSTQKVDGIPDLIAACQAEAAALLPDLNPIEKAWFKFRQVLRTARMRTIEALEQAFTGELKPTTATKPPLGPVTVDIHYRVRKKL